MRQLVKFKVMNFGEKVLTADSCLRIAICSLFFLVCTNTAYSKGFLFFGWGTEVYTIKEMPEDYTIQTEESGKTHVNLGVIYSDFSIFGIPLFNWDVDNYVLLPDNYKNKGTYTYYNISDEEFYRIQKKVGFLPKKPELSFWRRWGGKLILLPFIILILYGFLASLFKEEENKDKTSKQQ